MSVIDSRYGRTKNDKSHLSLSGQSFETYLMILGVTVLDIEYTNSCISGFGAAAKTFFNYLNCLILIRFEPSTCSIECPMAVVGWYPFFSCMPPNPYRKCSRDNNSPGS